MLYALSHAIQNIVGERIEEERHDVSVWDIKIGRVDVQGYDILAHKSATRIISNIPTSISVKTTRKFNSNDASER